MRDTSLIRFLIVGLVSGWIAAIVVRTPVRFRGCLTYMVIGMLGAVIGGFLFQAVGLSEVGSLVTATVGAIVLLVLVRLVRQV